MDDDEASPWAMQLVARVERQNPPTHDAVCEAAARAVVSLLDDPRCVDGPWAEAVACWTKGPIRKHARKARGVAWDRVQHFDGFTASNSGADVRAFIPGPVDQIPREISRLQLQSFELAHSETLNEPAVVPNGALVVSLLVLPTGKAAAAAGHAAQLAAMRMTNHRFMQWRADGFPVSVHQLDAHHLDLLAAHAPVVVRDAGFTVVAPNTTTAVARWQ
jgi:hypothetical protein